MQKKTAFMFIGLIAVVAVAIVGMFVLRGVNRSQFNWDYMIVDDTRWKTTMNDGGSSTNVYYQINFEDRVVRKCEDKYSGPLQQYEYREKVIYQTEFDDKTGTKLLDLLQKLWQSGDSEEGTYEFYTIENAADGPRYIYNKNSIAQIQIYTDKFNRLAASSGEDA